MKNVPTNHFDHFDSQRLLFMWPCQRVPSAVDFYPWINIPSGKRLQKAIENDPVEIVDLNDLPSGKLT